MEEILGKIGFDWKLALVNFVNVFLIFLVLRKWAFKPIQEIIQKRKNLVDQSLEGARKAEESVAGAKQEQQAILTKAREDAQAVIERAEDESKGIIGAGRVKALKEQEEILHKANLQIKQSQKEAMDEVKAEAASLISLGVKKILAEEVDEKMNERIIKRAANNI